ncbi:tyrosine-protein phosphatase [Thermodesulfobacteriota bacterium]
MIDIHSHILPWIDDGPSVLDESLKMAQIAVDDGIGTIIATPHCLNGLYRNWRTDILSACTAFNLVLKENHLPLTVLPGSEVHLGVEIMDELKNGRLMTINDTGRYLSIELPDQFIPETVKGFMGLLSNRRITAIITHPERNTFVQNNIRALYDLVSAGALIQVTAGSLMGRFGRRALKCTRKIVKDGMLHFLATDAHSSGVRPPRLSAAGKKLSSMVGEEMAYEVLLKRPQMIIDGE